MIPFSALRDNVEPSVLARGADELNVSVTLLRKTLRWLGELPPGTREELLSTVQKPACNVPRARHPGSLLLVGWSCPACFCFNGEAKATRTECRACGGPAPR